MTLPYLEAKLILLRHGESEGNAARIIQGNGEYPLSDKGREQAIIAKKTTSHWNPAVYISSNLSRAHDTALILSNNLEVIKDSRYNERGPVNGKVYREMI